MELLYAALEMLEGGLQKEEEGEEEGEGKDGIVDSAKGAGREDVEGERNRLFEKQHEDALILRCSTLTLNSLTSLTLTSLTSLTLTSLTSLTLTSLTLTLIGGAG